MILRLLARGRTGRRTAIPARTVETPRRSSVNLFKGHTTRSKPLIDANAWIAPRMGVPPGTVSQRARAGQEAGREHTDAEIWFANWERGGALAEEARHLTKWDQTLSLLWFESGEVPALPHPRRFHRWEADAPERHGNSLDDDEYIEELGDHLRWPTRRRRR